MSKIPPDVNELMWMIAESNNSQSIREFGLRFPELRAELVDRIRIINEFKGAKTPARQDKPVQFTKGAHRAAKNDVSWQLIASTCAVLALALTGLGYVLLAGKQANRDSGDTMSSVVVPQSQKPPQNGGVVYKPELSGSSGPQSSPSNQNSPGIQTYPSAQSNGNWANGSDPNHVGALGTGPQGTDVPKPITVVIKNAKLSDALTIIAAQANIKIQIAPGLKDPPVSIDYQQTLPQDILNSLGNQYGFTPFYQGNGLYVIIPAREKGNPGPTSGGADGLTPKAHQSTPEVTSTTGGGDSASGAHP